MKIILLLVLVTLVPVDFAGAQPLSRVTTEQSAAPTSDEILAKSAQTYLALQQFRGGCQVVYTTRISIKGAPAQTITQKGQAKFNFKRGAYFTITGLDAQGGAFAIDSRGAKTTLTTNFSGVHETEKLKDLASAVASMTGVAATAPTTIPALLMSEKWGFPYLHRSQASLKGHEKIGGHDCFLITQSSRELNRVSTFWIDSHSFLLRQMHEKQGELKVSEAQLRQTPEMRDFKVLSSETTHVFTFEDGRKP